MRERSLLHEDPKKRARREGWIREDAREKGDDNPWIPPARHEYLVRAGDEGGWKEEEPEAEFEKRYKESRLDHEERRRTDKLNKLIAKRNRWDESTRPDREKFYAIEKNLRLHRGNCET